MAYVELDITTAFSFLRGASLAEELVATASALGMAAIGIADHNTVAGVARAHAAARQVGIRLIVGSRLVPRDGTPDLICYPTDRAAWGRLTRLLTIGKSRAPKGECALDFADVAAHGDGQIVLAVPPDQLDAIFRDQLLKIAAAFPGRAYLAARRRHRGDDARRLRKLAELARLCGMPMVASNAVLYHAPERRMLRDVMTCIRLGTTIDKAGFALQANAEQYLKPPDEMARLFAAHPDAIGRTEEVARRCVFSLDELVYEYPDEPVPPGLTPDAHLAALTWAGAACRYPDGIPETLRANLVKELALIEKLGYARYFLTVHDIVQYARDQGILCQGRGSAANSSVCYCLHITAVDPTQIDLLFERFISAERQEPPDIDVDFEHERREEVIQYIYRRYGRDRAGIAATVIHYRPKMAAREVGRVMGLSEDATAALSAQSWNAAGELWPEDRLRDIGLDPDSEVVRRTVELARALVGFPRHLSQHVGGFILTRGRLDETVPIGPAAMADRYFIEWDKDDIDSLGIMKVDVLALGMLTCVRKAFDLLNTLGIRVAGRAVEDLAHIPNDDPTVYEMLTRADSLGVFQVESRAQMNMLPRLRPAKFYDLVIEVAIVRPGPIQGDMVHPYLRRRQNREEVVFPSPHPAHGDKQELERVLGRTLGVPLFQEQAMRIAIEAAKFTPEEANQLRRAMATFRHVGTIHKFFTKMVEGMVGRGYERDFAERCFRQIEGFGTYGFPESHAASFALLVYVSAWLKCHHPAVFACALLNSQPMGFYAPSQIVRDAREHGVAVRGVDVEASAWDCTLERGDGRDGIVLRLGLRQIGGFREAWGQRIMAARVAHGGRIGSFPALARAVEKPVLEALAEADALRGIGLDRRAGLWHVRGLTEDAMLPLFAALPVRVRSARLPLMALPEHVVADYQTTGLSLKAHPLGFMRARLSREGVRTCAETTVMRDATLVRVAGVVLVRQRPGSAGGVVFATIEDETGIANLVIWPALLERFRREIVGAALLQVDGRVQRSPEGIIHVVVERLYDRTAELRSLDDTGAATPATLARADEMPPRLPRSRDFH
jgi:error-prone DNA polymerase